MNKSVLIAGLGVLLLGGGAYVLTRPATPEAPGEARPSASPTPTAGGLSLVSEEERVAYVEANVVATDILVVPDTKPADGGEGAPVPGLMRVKGTVTNNGTRLVRPVFIRVNLFGPKVSADGVPAEGETVIGSYLEDTCGSRPLEPGVPRAFQFTIPEKKAWNGKLTHKLQ